MTGRRRRGFTLIELLLVSAIVALLSGIVLTAYRSVQIQLDTALITTDVTELFHRAQTKARAADSDSAWGVFIEASQLTLFKLNLAQNERFATPTRDRSADEVVPLPAGVTANLVQEIIFRKLWGFPLDSPSAISLTLPNGNQGIVELNSLGRIAGRTRLP